jgi:hypothetical protein
LETLPQLPNVNPIEHIWQELKRCLQKCKISNKNDLKNALLEEWRKEKMEKNK